MIRNSSGNRRLYFERLERRELLCSSTLGTSILQSAAQSALFARAHSSNATATNSTTTNSGSSDEASETHLFTTLTNSAGVVVGTASYETEVNGTTTAQKLVIDVAGAAANASYNVTVGTTVLGTLTTDANGNGRLILTSSSSSSTAGSTASSNCAATGTLPDGFTLAAGATINLASTDTTVDPLNGTFATASGDIGLGNGIGGGVCYGNHGTSTKLVASLSDAGSTVGKAGFTTITNADGTTTEILWVRVTGAGDSSTLDVSIDGTSVGSLTTDSNGNGLLILSSNPQNSNVGLLPTGLTITSSSTITVGTSITGTFGSSSSTGTTSTGVTSASRFLFRRR